jgi:hypothetical protein
MLANDGNSKNQRQTAEIDSDPRLFGRRSKIKRREEDGTRLLKMVNTYLGTCAERKLMKGRERDRWMGKSVERGFV